MLDKGVTGELSETTLKRFEWKILNFSTLYVTRECFYDSPSFTFMNMSSLLRMSPPIPSFPYLSVYLGFVSGPLRNATFSLSIKQCDGTLIGTKIFDKNIVLNENLGFHQFFEGSVLQRQKLELLPSDVLTIICDLKPDSDGKQILPLETNIASGSEQPERSNLKDRIAVAASEHIKLIGEEPLCRDYKKVFLEGQNHDLILKVGDKEFPVHRDILRARSQVFESMLSHDMKEKNSSSIDVPDCDPNAMEQFLLYVYCGKVETLDESNMIGLYYVADKYDMAALKEECSDFIKKSLSPTNASEVIQLALNHSDSALQEYGTEYFCNNSHNILRTLEWQCFMKDNSTVANELLIKSIDALRNAKK